MEREKERGESVKERERENRLVAREEPPFPFASEPAARFLRLDTALLSSSITTEILRESVG